MIRLAPEVGDDEGYLERVSCVVSGVLDVVRPEGVFVVKVDQWFGERWCDFSHKCMGAFGVRAPRNPPVPPFHPHRVRWQRHLAARGDAYAYDGEGFVIHVSQSSESNEFRYLACRPFRNSVLVWFTGNSARLGRGSLMVYGNRPSDRAGRVLLSTWFASFDRAIGWRADRRIHVSPRELAEFESRGSALVSAEQPPAG